MKRFVPVAIATIAITLCHRVSACSCCFGNYIPDFFCSDGDGSRCLQDNECDNMFLCDPALSYMEMAESSAEACCRSHLSSSDWEYSNCLRNSDYDGTNKWYVDEVKRKCVQDCATVWGGSCTNPGGVVYPSDGVTLYDDPGACCTARLSHMKEDFCVAKSLDDDYPGSYDFYVDYANDRCVQDCVYGDGAAGPCLIPGGIIETSDVELYENSEACCIAELSFMDQDLCQSNSYPWSLGTAKWYAGPDSDSEGQCTLDRDGCPILTLDGVICLPVPDTSIKLYYTQKECCAEALAPINSRVCEMKSEGYPTELWFLPPADSRQRRMSGEVRGCSKDCDATELISNSGAPEPYCADITDVYGSFFETPEACCSGVLGWIDEELCIRNSVGVPTEKWFLADQDRCAKDCGAAELTSNSGEPELYCLDITSNYIGGFFDTAEECCSKNLSWVDGDLCASKSFGIPSEKWFSPDGGLDFRCAKDCGPAELAEPYCADAKPHDSAVLFDSVEDCCSGSLWWVDSDSCIARTTGGYTNGWYVDYAGLKCVKDCDASASPECAGTPEDFSAKLFADSAACCASALGWMDQMACVAQSAGEELRGSGLYYVNWSIGKCVKDCEGAAPCGGLAKSWDYFKYSDATMCCEIHLFWKDRGDCILS